MAYVNGVSNASQAIEDFQNQYDNYGGMSLLQNPTRVSTPYIKVDIGGYIFGVYQRSETAKLEASGGYRYIGITYPNFIQGLTIAKINGQVNTYTLNISYGITGDNDPNFFEKIFSKVSQTRKITFSYGDMSAPTFIYKNEEAIITNVSTSIDIKGAKITYNVSAVSSSKLATAYACNFPGITAKPSDVIVSMLRNNSKYGLLDIYTGMRDVDKVLSQGLIARDDIIVSLEAKSNISVLDYLQYLVNSMKRNYSNDVYVFKTIDDTTGDWGGPYFKVIKSSAAGDSLDTYELDIGFPTANVVDSITIQNDQEYSILYQYSKVVNNNEYVQRIDDKGNLINMYSPIVGSNTPTGLMQAEDESWWKNVTQFPINVEIKIKGVLRPTVLMSKVRLKIYFYGRLHAASGLYIINKEVDEVGMSGCWTTLSLIRVGGDNATNS